MCWSRGNNVSAFGIIPLDTDGPLSSESRLIMDAYQPIPAFQENPEEYNHNETVYAEIYRLEVMVEVENIARSSIWRAMNSLLCSILRLTQELNLIHDSLLTSIHCDLRSDNVPIVHTEEINERLGSLCVIRRYVRNCLQVVPQYAVAGFFEIYNWKEFYS